MIVTITNSAKIQSLESLIYVMYHILIIEDEARIASFIDKGLRKHGFSTAIAPDGEIALFMVKEQKFDLLLLDLSLPIKDGWTVLEELSLQGIDIPVIIVTAQERVYSNTRTLDYLTKPFRFQALLARIYRYLDPNF